MACRPDHAQGVGDVAGAVGVPAGALGVTGADVVGVRVFVGEVERVLVGVRDVVGVDGPELGADGGALGEDDTGGEDEVGAGVLGRLGCRGEPLPSFVGAGRIRK